MSNLMKGNVLKPVSLFGANTAEIANKIAPKPSFVLNPRASTTPRLLERPAGGLNTTFLPKNPER